MEEYSKGSVEVEDKQRVEARVEVEDKQRVEARVEVEDKQRVEAREQDKEVKEEDSSSSNSSSDTEEKLVSDSVELSQDVEKWGDPYVAELDAKETEDNISPVVADQAASENDGVVADQAASENDGVVADQAASENNSGNSLGFPELESKDKDDDLLQAANVSILETKPDIHESMENQPIMPLHPRVVRPTSWKSCCGLLEVLRRSDR